MRDGGTASALARLRSLLDKLPALITDRARLLTPELRRARAALFVLMGLAVAAALSAATAWFALCAALVAFVADEDIGRAWAASAIALVHGAAAAFLFWRMRNIAPLLALRPTMRQLGMAEDHGKDPCGETNASAPPQRTGHPDRHRGVPGRRY
jgi:uncharacterized membrane protein YqjE